MEEKTGNELYMPSGLKMKKEYFSGFGKDELIPTVIAALGFLIVDCFLFLGGCKNVGLLFFVPVIGVSLIGMLQVKGELNLSPVDIINLEIQFRRSQKYYPYIAKNEWENIE